MSNILGKTHTSTKKFGLGAFEEEEDIEDIYNNDTLDSYDKILGGETETLKTSIKEVIIINVYK